jgi:hypothetical protein
MSLLDSRRSTGRLPADLYLPFVRDQDPPFPQRAIGGLKRDVFDTTILHSCSPLRGLQKQNVLQRIVQAMGCAHYPGAGNPL